MKDEGIATLDNPDRESGIDVGRPVEWMVDSERRDLILGVTYEFAETGVRRTVWYTPNKRRPKACVVVAELSEIMTAPVEA